MSKKTLKASFKRRLIDIINTWRALISLTLTLVFVVFYMKGWVKSIRLSVSDVLAVSSIILGILGVFIGLLISLQSSSFLKKLKEYSESRGGNFDAFAYLIKYVKNAFVKDIVFILLTVFIDFVPVDVNYYLKLLLIGIWSVLFLLSLWEVFFSVDFIVQIVLYKAPRSNKKTMT